MKLLTFSSQRAPGFRLNLLDIIFIFCLCTLSYFLANSMPNNSFFAIPLYLGISFFCFCNLFRIGNKMEPFWYLPFFIIAVYCLHTFNLELFWLLVLSVLEPLKWGLILYCIKTQHYHGIAYKWVNKLKAKSL